MAMSNNYLSERQALVAPEQRAAGINGRRFGMLSALWDASLFGRVHGQQLAPGGDSVHMPLPSTDVESGLAGGHAATAAAHADRPIQGVGLPSSRLPQPGPIRSTAAAYTALAVDDMQDHAQLQRQSTQQQPQQQLEAQRQRQQQQQQQQQQQPLHHHQQQHVTALPALITLPAEPLPSPSASAQTTAQQASEATQQTSALRLAASAPAASFHQALSQQLAQQSADGSPRSDGTSSPVQCTTNRAAITEPGTSPRTVEASFLGLCSSSNGSAGGSSNVAGLPCTAPQQLRRPSSLRQEGSWGSSMVGALVASRNSQGSSAGMVRSGSGLMPTCLICLDSLTAADFESGEAMSLQCACKGEVALRHRSCAVKWSQVKGSTICDVCKAPIANLPAVAPRPTDEGDGPVDGAVAGEPPAAADYVFDCIRVTWVTMIICILFFELSVARSFLLGAVVGAAYTTLTRALHRHHRALQLHAQQQGQQPGQQGGMDGGLAASAIILV